MKYKCSKDSLFADAKKKRLYKRDATPTYIALVLLKMTYNLWFYRNSFEILVQTLLAIVANFTLPLVIRLFNYYPCHSNNYWAIDKYHAMHFSIIYCLTTMALCVSNNYSEHITTTVRLEFELFKLMLCRNRDLLFLWITTWSRNTLLESLFLPFYT